jgi:Uma2 family endonuclease
MATTTTPDFDGLTLHQVEWETYCKLRDEESNNHVRMTYLDGELTLMSGLFENGGLTLRNVEWKVYEKLRDDPANDHLRMTYLDGNLTIMSPQIVHDVDSRRFVHIIAAAAKPWLIEFLAVGTTTLRRKGQVTLKSAAKEPDEGFYLGEDVARIRRKTVLDLAIDPPPTLAIEVDNKADSKVALPTYARIRVPEVWLYKVQDNTLWFGRLAGKGYKEIGRSLGLPRLTPTLVMEAVDAALAVCQSEIEWHNWLDAWARALPAPPEGGR